MRGHVVELLVRLISCWRGLFSNICERAHWAGVRRRVVAASDCDLIIVEGECIVRVQGVVRERVHSGKRWMQLAVTTDGFLSMHTDYVSYAK